MAEHATALVGGELDAPEIRPGHTVDAVVIRQELVEERIAGVDELADRPVVAQDGVEEQARLGLHRLTQLGAPRRKLLRIRA